jgi:putative membrane protein
LTPDDAVDNLDSLDPRRQREVAMEEVSASPLSPSRKMSRSQQALMGLILFFWAAASLAHLLAWIRHDPPLKIELVIFTNTGLLAMAVWHSLEVKGRRATAAFFSTAVIISWLCEFIGHNYGWFFGSYHYTDTLGPRVGGVPVVIIVTWSSIMYAAFMLIDWLLDLNGERRGRSWPGRALWSGLVAASTATLVCAWDLMIDPFATSSVWRAVGKEPWWYWMKGGPYLRGLEVPGDLNPAGGVPVGNFVGWWLAPFFVILLFMLFFQRPNRIRGSFFNLFPLLSYSFILFSVAVLVLEMQWYGDRGGKDMVQVALIGFFTMMPVITVSLVKLARDRLEAGGADSVDGGGGGESGETAEG